jgi:hypothetical protein
MAKFALALRGFFVLFAIGCISQRGRKRRKNRIHMSCIGCGIPWTVFIAPGLLMLCIGWGVLSFLCIIIARTKWGLPRDHVQTVVNGSASCVDTEWFKRCYTVVCAVVFAAESTVLAVALLSPSWPYASMSAVFNWVFFLCYLGFLVLYRTGEASFFLYLRS